MRTDALREFAGLLNKRNTYDDKLAQLIKRPATTAHLVDWLAAQIFDVRLESAGNKPVDGEFKEGILTGRTVNIRWCAKRDGGLDLCAKDGPDYYLVLTGPRAEPASSRNTTRPVVIAAVHLFNAESLVSELRRRGVGLRNPVSVRSELWSRAEIYPRPSTEYVLSSEQRIWLKRFG